jgi:hypothetical protein
LLSWTNGNHNISLGFNLELDESNIRNTDFENGNVNFTNDVTGLAMASFVYPIGGKRAIWKAL